jgi:hypothetical protein
VSEGRQAGRAGTGIARPGPFSSAAPSGSEPGDEYGSKGSPIGVIGRS